MPVPYLHMREMEQQDYADEINKQTNRCKLKPENLKS